MNRPAALLAAASLGVLGIVCAQRSVAAAADGGYEPPPLALYGQLPALKDPALSPSGDRLAYLMRLHGRRYIAVIDLETGKALAAARIGSTKVRELRWYDEHRLLILYSTTSYPPFGVFGHRREWFMLGTWNLKNNSMRSVNMRDSTYDTLNDITGSLEMRMVKGRPQLFAMTSYLSGRDYLPALFRIDLRHDYTSLIAGGDTLGADWAVDAQGRVAASLEDHLTGSDDGEWVLRLRHNNDMKRIAQGTSALDPPSMIGFSYDGKALIVAFDTPSGWIWKPLSLKTGTWGAPLDSGNDFFDVIRDRLTGRILGGVEDPSHPRQVFFDRRLQAHWSSLTTAYAGERVELVSHSDDFSKFLLRVFGQRDGDSYWIINWRTIHAHRLGGVYRGLRTFAKVEPVTYHAADGLRLSGFLTLPPDRAAKHLSLVVMPHGGPAASDDGDFDWWAQALASRGYAVLQVNYRGSDTTTALLRAGYGQWGRKMQTDLSDGVKYLVRRGIVDPRRVCIVGASYGGYAALAGVTLQSGIYRCAVSVAGVADLAAFLHWTSQQMFTSRNAFTLYWDRFLGVTGPDDPRLRAISPIDHVAAVTVPVLLIHGRDDTVVPYSQSAAMARALRRAGKSVQLVSLPNEDHWLSHSATRELMLKTVVKFLQQNDPPR
jgi:dipeptidyl aminopeptidase/acylaminoacyl peptidase